MLKYKKCQNAKKISNFVDTMLTFYFRILWSSIADFSNFNIPLKITTVLYVIKNSAIQCPRWNILICSSWQHSYNFIFICYFWKKKFLLNFCFILIELLLKQLFSKSCVTSCMVPDWMSTWLPCMKYKNKIMWSLVLIIM